ncbi:MAG TPA: hypothetical protein VK149_03595 [Sideroxyarcus sp.]|nr:hypothetical protein [Sideroxyarcus sp.]
MELIDLFYIIPAIITPDLINGLFEIGGGVFVLNHCRVLYADKQVRGVSLVSVAFFSLWGCWNLYYYPSLNQPLSFYGGLFVTAANALYLGMACRYRFAEQPDEHSIYMGVETGAFPRQGDQA